MHPTSSLTTPLSRRRALALLSLSGAALASGAATAAPLYGAGVARPYPETPEAALGELVAGNLRFVDGRPLGPRRTLQRVRDVAEEQKPFAAVLACADSRVPVEILFDQGFGDIFVCRAAGNVITPEIIASLEYGTWKLGAKVLVVLGHSDCGAVDAAIAGGEAPGQITALYSRIQPAVDRVPSRDPEEVARQNVLIQTGLLRTASPVLRQLVADGKLLVKGGFYSLPTARVSIYPD